MEDVEAYSGTLGCPISDAELKGRSERVRGRAMLMGSIITGGSSIPLVLSAAGTGVGGVMSGDWRDDERFSSFSFIPSSLLDFRDW